MSEPFRTLRGGLLLTFVAVSSRGAAGFSPRIVAPSAQARLSLGVSTILTALVKFGLLATTMGLIVDAALTSVPFPGRSF